MDLPRELTNHLFHLAQSTSSGSVYGLIGADGGIPCACFSLDTSTKKDAAELVVQLHARGLSPFATFALSEDLSAPPERPRDLALPSLPHLVIGTRIKGVLEIDAFLEGPSGWSPVELRLPAV